jgi:glycerol-3-phosphate acyltransferase PlsY
LTNLLGVIILSYIVGSIPASVIISKIFTNTDIREYGSGNPGAANVYRTVGRSAGALTAFFDLFKGAASALWIARISYDIHLFENETISFIAGGAAVLGHIFSIFLKFKGGKGVAAAAGVFFVMTPIAAAISLIIFVSVVIITKISSLGSLISTCLTPFILFVMSFYTDIPKNAICFAIFIALLILFAHRKNIGHIIKGKENRI